MTSPTVSPTFSLSESEQQVYRSYDNIWRLRLVSVIAPFFGLTTFMSLVGLLAFLVVSAHGATTEVSVALPPQMAYLSMGSLVVVISLYGYSTYAARKGQARRATTACATALLIATTVAATTWEFSQGVGPFGLAGYIFLPLVIVLVGLLATAPFILLATLWVNTLTITYTLLAPREAGIAGIVQREAILIVFFCVLMEWCFAILLIALRRALSATLRELGDVRIAYERAKQLDEIKDQFIRSVNHELRNPVMALNGYVKVLRSQQTALSPERQRAFLDRASQVGDRVVAMLKSILDTGRLEQNASEFTPEAVNVRTVIAESAELLDPLEGSFVQRELHLSIPDDLMFWGDRIRLQQIMTHLLSNAVKYSPAGSPVTVEAYPIRPAEAPKSSALFGRSRQLNRPQMVEITVRDQGEGIPPDQIPLLFQRFMRLPRDIASPVIGNGLRLFICRQLAEAMGGSIWVESQGIAGKGSTFHLRLPMPPTQN